MAIRVRPCACACPAFFYSFSRSALWCLGSHVSPSVHLCLLSPSFMCVMNLSNLVVGIEEATGVKTFFKTHVGEEIDQT